MIHLIFLIFSFFFNTLAEEGGGGGWANALAAYVKNPEAHKNDVWVFKYFPFSFFFVIILFFFLFFLYICIDVIDHSPHMLIHIHMIMFVTFASVLQLKITTW